jgi:hypothetical protein
MAYTITNSDGTPLLTIPDGQFDTTTALTLAGANSVGYGQILNQNLVNLLENFASNSAPVTNNQIGQLWFNKTTQALNVFVGGSIGFTPVSGILLDEFTPVDVTGPGTLWFNPTNNQLSVYGTNGFNLISYYSDANVAAYLSTASISTTSITLSGAMQFANLTTAQITSIASPTHGMTVYNYTTGNIQVYNGAKWANVVLS